MKTPCEPGCQERDADCHAKCQKYAEYRAIKDKERDERNAEVYIACQIYAERKDRYWRLRRRGRA